MIITLIVGCISYSLHFIAEWYSLERLMLKLQYFGHLIWKANPLEKTLMLGNIEGKRRRGRERMRCSEIITDSMNMNLSKLQEIMEDSGAWQVTVHRVQRIRHDWSKFTNTKTSKMPSDYLKYFWLLIVLKITFGKNQTKSR